MPARALPRRTSRRRVARPALSRGPRAVHPILLGLAGLALLAPVFGSCGATASAPAPSPAAPGLDIPADYLALYRAAGSTCPGLDWAVLAGIGRVETNHGRSTLPGVHSGQNFAGAMGPMQFLAGTFAAVRQRHPEIGDDVYDPTDAIPAAANYLCDNGYSSNPRGAVWQYNHADWYVNEVLAQASAYCETTPNASVACPTFQSTLQSSGEHFSSRALVAVRFACAQLGKPYVWGGNGDPGFDCSGLTKAAYAAAGIDLPRTAQTQYDAGPRLPASASPLPGDLLFFGTPNDIHHVGISLGGALIVNAPTFGQPVQVADYRSFGDYAGASRPAGVIAG